MLAFYNKFSELMTTKYLQKIKTKKNVIKPSKLKQMKPSKQTIIKLPDKIKIEVSVHLLKEGNYFVAYCPALDLSSYGKTEAEARQAFNGAMKIFLEETEKRGTLEKELLNLGWALRKLPEICYEPPRIDERNLIASMKKVTNVHYENVAIPV
jgi:predicted RNase H-like HicB family nuclease